MSSNCSFSLTAAAAESLSTDMRCAIIVPLEPCVPSAAALGKVAKRPKTNKCEPKIQKNTNQILIFLRNNLNYDCDFTVKTYLHRHFPCNMQATSVFLSALENHTDLKYLHILNLFNKCKLDTHFVKYIF